MLVLGKMSENNQVFIVNATDQILVIWGIFIVDEINLKIFRFIRSDMVFDIDNLHKGDAKWFWQYIY